MEPVAKKTKVGVMDDGAAPSAASTSTPAFDPASVRDLEALTLAAPHVDASRLLAIIQELRQTAGVSTFVLFLLLFLRLLLASLLQCL